MSTLGSTIHGTTAMTHTFAPSIIHVAATIAALVLAPTGIARSQSAPNVQSGDASRGRVLYQACTGCHSIDEDDIGPRHRGVVGRAAGTVPGYAYSAALKRSGFVWDPVSLDRWLTNPQAMIPGAKMFFAIRSAEDRADIIAYLSELQ